MYYTHGMDTGDLNKRCNWRFGRENLKGTSVFGIVFEFVFANNTPYIIFCEGPEFRANMSHLYGVEYLIFPSDG